MNKFFKISIALNIALAGFVLWMLHSRSATETSSLALANSPVAFLSPSNTIAATVEPCAPKFRWSELESADYRVYIANLRRIGCPESTIHDIITADADEAIYEPRRDELKPYAGTTTLENALQELNQQETNFIAALLGDTPAPARAASEPPRVPRPRVASQAERELARPASMPLVLQSIDPVAMKLTEAQTATIESLRQNFAEELGGTNQNPNDANYRQRWQVAQREADNMLIGILGRNFVNNYQSQAAPSN